MKKILALLLAAVMCLSLVACGGEETPSANDNGGTQQSEQLSGESTENNTTENTEDSNDTNDATDDDTTAKDTVDVADLIVYDPGGDPNILSDKFPELVEVIELTTENWKDYIKVYSYADGENVYYQLGAGNERYHQFNGVTIELKNISTGEITSYDFSLDGVSDIPEDLNLDNYECISIQGRLYFVNLPDEAFISDDLGKYFIVRSYVFRIMDGTNGIHYDITDFLG